MKISVGNSNRQATFATGVPIVDIPTHLFNMVLSRDVFSYLTIANTIFGGTPTQTGFRLRKTN